MNKRLLICLVLLFNFYYSWGQDINLAITNCNIITMNSDRVLKNKTILISGDKIHSIVSSANWKSTKVIKTIDATNKFVIPALVDMHIHSNTYIDNFSMPMFLKYGITTVRVMAGNKDILNKRDSVKNNLLPNYPDIFVASELIDGAPPSFGNDHIGPIVTDASEIQKKIDEQMQKGYDFIKMYSRLNKDVFRTGLKYCKTQKIKSTHHMPTSIDKEDYFTKFTGEIQHLSGYARFSTKYDSLPKSVLLKNYDVPFDQISAQDIDEKKLRRAVNKTIKYNIWNCPTLVLFYNQTDTLFCKSILENKIGEGLNELLGWWQSVGYGGSEKIKNYNNFQMQTVNLLNKKGDLLLAGTDFPNPWLVPGLSLHQELERFVAAGLSNFEALKTATINPAKWFGNNYSKGTIEKDKQADLLILEDNPLVDIKNTKKIYKVIYKGK